MRKKITSGIIIAAAAVVLVYCLVQMMPKLKEYKESDDTYRRIRKEAVDEPDGPASSSSGQTDDVMHIDWEALKGTDCVAWLVLDDISYPVMHTDDNTLYLHHLPDKSYNYGGSIFLYSDNDPYFTDENSFLYGHNMANRSMFGNLKRYRGPQYANHVFYLYLPDGTRHTYTFFSVLSVEKSDRAYSYSFGSKDSFVDYQNYVKGKSLYQTGPAASADNKLVSLSTCDGYEGTSHRLVVQGAETAVIQAQEPASWYVPEADSKYNIVQKKVIRKLKMLGLTQKQAEKIEDVLVENSVEDINYFTFATEQTDRGFQITADGADNSRYILYIDSQDNHLYAVKKVPKSAGQAEENGASADGIWIWQE